LARAWRYGSSIERQSTPLLIYDGDCSFCTASTNWAAARWSGRARAIPWQTLTSVELSAHELTREDVRCAAWWIDEDGRHLRGHLAIAQALRAGSGWWGFVGRVLFVRPFRWVGGAVYLLIARLASSPSGRNAGL
jgi:predicted DCC family thiol-disulfide oxidoreductase YuxK